jgi:RNase adaptor protein for sRNA GlmZ degradation
MTNPAPVRVTVTSFGYGHQDEDGQPVPPPAAHITIDVRTHFRDPHVSPELRDLTGDDRRVVVAVMSTPGVAELIDATVAQVEAFRAAPVPGPVTVAIGCVGGRHRSVVIAAFIAALLPGKVDLTHRDIGRPVIARPSRDTRAGAGGCHAGQVPRSARGVTGHDTGP